MAAAPTHHIVGVEFGVLTESELRRMSVMEVTRSALYEKGVPADKGLNSLELGTCDNKFRCKTCRHSVRDCPGHFGHMVLHRSCYHPLFVDYVVKILRVVCYWCSASLASEDHVRTCTALPARSRLTRLSGLTKGRACPKCGGPQPAYGRAGMHVKCEWPAETAFATPEEAQFARRPFTASVAKSILAQVPDHAVTTCGFDVGVVRPSDLIVDVLPVPPPIIRPAVAYQAGSRLRGQEDLTIKLLDIFKANAATKTRACAADELQLHLNLYIDKDTRPTRDRAASRGPRVGPSKSLMTRHRGKKGRFRCNIIGKRVDFSSRGVITPDASLDVDQVGVPLRIALEQTIPVVATRRNLKLLRQRVRNGPRHRHGAVYVTQPDGTTIRLAMRSPDLPTPVTPGTVVHRTLEDDDWIVVNRQPTLHKGSMMAHRVKVVSGTSIRLNLCVTPPYNADFDGDEMNLHLPQSWRAIAELKHIMAVERHMLTDASGRPSVRLVQDALLAVFHLTKRGTLIDRAEMAYLVGHTRLPPPALSWRAPGESAWTHRYSGKQALSCFLPRIDVARRARGLDGADPFDERDVYVRHGRLLRGQLCKETVNTPGGILHLICLDFGNARAAAFLSGAVRMLHRFFASYGFSIGVDDISIQSDTYARVDRVLGVAFRHLREVRRTHRGARLEAHTARVLQDLLPRCGQIVLDRIAPTNALRCMVKGTGSGSKGSRMNVAQMAGLVGQQVVTGSRVFGHNGRTLPSFLRDSADPRAHGLCVHPYTAGLTPSEFFYHAMGGREGLVDTAVKTASTGYIHRRLATYMKHLMVYYDGTVRNYLGQIVSFLYGEDGWSAERLEAVPVPELLFANERVLRVMGRSLGEEFLRLRTRYLSSVLHLTTEATVYVPVNVRRVVLGIVHGRGTVRFAAPLIEQQLAWLRRHAWREPNTGLLLTTIACLSQTRTNTYAQQSAIVHTLRRRILGAVCPPGFMAGTVAAQSIGEPTTQMTLNSFHHAGVASELVMTGGVRRLQECIDISKNIATPVSVIPTRAPSVLREAVRHVRLSDVTARVYAALGPNSHTALHDELTEIVHGGPRKPLHPQMCVVELDKAACAAHGVLVTDAQCRTQAFYRARGVDVCSTETCADVWRLFVRASQSMATLRLKTDTPAAVRARVLVDLTNGCLEAITLKGVPDVTRVVVQTKPRAVRDHATGVVRTVPETVVTIQGSNLRGLLGLTIADTRRVYSNNVCEVAAVLGIEAAMRVLYKEITDVLSSDGNYIDSRHVWLLVKCITRFGYLAPVSRHGMRRMDMGTLVLASYEETRAVFRNAAIYGAQDLARGVTQSIMFGNVPPIGTGMGFKIVPPYRYHEK